MDVPPAVRSSLCSTPWHAQAWWGWVSDLLLQKYVPLTCPAFTLLRDRWRAVKKLASTTKLTAAWKDPVLVRSLHTYMASSSKKFKPLQDGDYTVSESGFAGFQGDLPLHSDSLQPGDSPSQGNSLQDCTASQSLPEVALGSMNDDMYFTDLDPWQTTANCWGGVILSCACRCYFSTTPEGHSNSLGAVSPQSKGQSWYFIATQKSAEMVIHDIWPESSSYTHVRRSGSCFIAVCHKVVTAAIICSLLS